MPAPPKPPTSLASSLIIAEHASLTGTHLITLGSNTVVHPRARFSSAHAPINVGSSCIICERSSIGFQSEAAANERQGVVIENGVVIEVGALVEAKTVGEGTIIEVQAKIGKGAVLGRVRRKFPGYDCYINNFSTAKLARSVKLQMERSFRTSLSYMQMECGE